jgi:D-apionolactonase
MAEHLSVGGTRISLRAGPFDLLFLDGDLRSVKLGPSEVLQRIYFAIRDPYWRTVASRLGEIKLTSGSDSFAIEYAAEDRMGEVEFRRQVRISGDSDGTVRFCVSGEAARPFRASRVGICVLHGSRNWRGQSCTIEHADGTIESSSFPNSVSPHQPFLDIRAIRHHPPGGPEVEIRFDGEVFEMEDQRNWSDGSFKTYCPPLRIPFPRDVVAGENISLSVTIRCIEPPGKVFLQDLRPVVRVGEGGRRELPNIGLGISCRWPAPDGIELRRLGELNLSHLRTDLRLTDPGWREEIAGAARISKALDAPLEAVLQLSKNTGSELKEVAEFAAGFLPPICRWLVYRIGTKTTPADLLDEARRILSSGSIQSPIGGGAYNYFADLNRNRPAVSGDWLTFSLNPQVHAFDNRSLMENLAGQGDMVETALGFAAGVPLAVTPITLRPRFNPNMSYEQNSTEDGQSARLDPRLSQLFSAAWTAGSVQRLASAGTASLTYFEAVGPLGLMHAAVGPGLLRRVSPAYFVFAWLAAFRGGFLMNIQTGSPGVIETLGLCSADRRRLLLVNLEDAVNEADVHGLPISVRMKRLNSETQGPACDQPEVFLNVAGERLELPLGSLNARLSPYEIVCLDWKI